MNKVANMVCPTLFSGNGFQPLMHGRDAVPT